MTAALRELSVQPAAFTPYDRYMGAVRAVIANLDARDASVTLARQLMEEGHSFKYRMDDPYRAQRPATTAAKRCGDCKSKSLWLYHKLGDPRALYVVGKAKKRSRVSHAWLYWYSERRWWILDCTARTRPIAADSVAPDRYVPYYSWSSTGSYRHKATRLIVASAESPKPPAPVAFKIAHRDVRN